MRRESPGDTVHTPQVGRRHSPCHRDLSLLESRNLSPSAGKRAALVTRDDQAADLDLLAVLLMRQLADRLYACASKGIPPRRSQAPFQTDTRGGETESV
jgi:hypothetical protein